MNFLSPYVNVVAQVPLSKNNIFINAFEQYFLNT